MSWISKLRNNMFLRNLTADIFGRSAYSKTPGNFIPYFQYKIGSYQQDFYLHFPQEPYLKRYHNEFFNKLFEYSGYDIITLLEFHYSAFDNKQDFLQFLKFEITDRLNLKIPATRRQKLQTALEWIQHTQEQRSQWQQSSIKLEIEKQTREMLVDPSNETDSVVQRFVEKLSQHIDQFMTGAEEKFSAITEKLPTGRIELNNRNHEESIIQLFILIQQIQAPVQIAKGEQLFKRFAAADLAAILHLHFEAFRDNKINTIQRKIADQLERIKPNQLKVKNLNQSLQDFFY